MDSFDTYVCIMARQTFLQECFAFTIELIVWYWSVGIDPQGVLIENCVDQLRSLQVYLRSVYWNFNSSVTYRKQKISK